MIDKERLRVHGIIPFSLTNGPGSRVAIWLQGCSLGCTGCFNPKTHSIHAGAIMRVSSLVNNPMFQNPEIEGITVSGGEPLQQMVALINFLTQIKVRTSLSIILFTGYSWEEVILMPGTKELQTKIDVLIAGKYDYTKRIGRNLVGSSNKTFHFLTNRYNKDDFILVPDAEVIIEDGMIISSGINPIAQDLF